MEADYAFERAKDPALTRGDEGTLKTFSPSLGPAARPANQACERTLLPT